MICSQSFARTFDNIAWQKMCNDLESAAGEIFLPNKYTIRWIKATADAKKLINQKAPFLAAMIQNIEVVNGKISIANVTLKDLTGEIQGTINHDLYKQFSSDLTINSVIVLKQIGVLTTPGPKHYLNITANNLVKIYSLHQLELSENINLQRTVQGIENTYSQTCEQNQGERYLENSELITIDIQNFNIKDFLKSLDDIKSQHKARIQNINSSRERINLNFQRVNFGDMKTNVYENNNANNFGIVKYNKSTVELGSKPNEIGNTSKQKFNFKNVGHNNSASVNTSTTNNYRRDIENTEVGSNNLQLYQKSQQSIVQTNIFEDNVDIDFDEIDKKLEVDLQGLSKEKLLGQKRKRSDEVPDDCPETFKQPLACDNENQIQCSQITISDCDSKYKDILEDVFDGLDADAVFGSF